MAGGQEILGHGVFLRRQQLSSGNSDQLDGDPARFAVGVRVDVGIAVRETNHRRQGLWHGEHALPGILGQISQNLEFGQNPAWILA